MENIVKKISDIDELFYANGCSQEQIDTAQKELNLSFPQEFIDYVKEYGTISFYATEWKGLNVDGYLNVVESTKEERRLNAAFPDNCFVLENLGIDGLITVADESGKVFGVHYENIEFICDSLSDYLDICIDRSKK